MPAPYATGTAAGSGTAAATADILSVIELGKSGEIVYAAYRVRIARQSDARCQIGDARNITGNKNGKLKE